MALASKVERAVAVGRRGTTRTERRMAWKSTLRSTLSAMIVIFHDHRPIVPTRKRRM